MHSKIIFKPLEDELNLLSDFCNRCKELGYYNNQSFEAIKLSEMKMPHGQYFIGLDLDKNIIINLCGVHHIPDINNNAYRVFYRGVGLPGYHTGRGGIKGSLQLMISLNMQVDFILEKNPTAEFYFTTNAEKSSTNAKSHSMDTVMAPKMQKIGLCTKIQDNFYYMYTTQTLWRLNVDTYKQWRES